MALYSNGNPKQKQMLYKQHSSFHRVSWVSEKTAVKDSREVCHWKEKSLLTFTPTFIFYDCLSVKIFGWHCFLLAIVFVACFCVASFMLHVLRCSETLRITWDNVSVILADLKIGSHFSGAKNYFALNFFIWNYQDFSLKSIVETLKVVLSCVIFVTWRRQFLLLAGRLISLHDIMKHMVVVVIKYTLLYQHAFYLHGRIRALR